MIKWQIASRARRCTQTNAPFQPEEPVWTYLFREREANKDGQLYHREDVCAEGRKALGKERIAEAFSQWQTRFKPNLAGDGGAEPTAEQRLGPEGLFRRLVEEDLAATLNTRYVLAIMLERRKALKEVDRRDTEEGPLLVYEHGKSGEVFLVLDPGLKLADIVGIQEEVAAQLTQTEAAAANAPE
jgi:hypothetical protein